MVNMYTGFICANCGMAVCRYSKTADGYRCERCGGGPLIAKMNYNNKQVAEKDIEQINARAQGKLEDQPCFG